jgi:AraC-like DNA-binding protein
VLLEIEARLRRLAADLSERESSRPPAAEPPHSGGSLGRFEKMATLIARHFHEPLLIRDIAEAVHLTPDSAMRLFRKISGITLHECLLRHRVSNAQRLSKKSSANPPPPTGVSSILNRAELDPIPKLPSPGNNRRLVRQQISVGHCFV